MRCFCFNDTATAEIYTLSLHDALPIYVHPAAHRVPWLLVVPVVALGAIGLVGGFFSGPFERLAEATGEVSFGAPTPLDASYHLEILPEYVMALAAYTLGAVVIVSRPVWSRAALGFSGLGKVLGPERAYGLAIEGLN